MVPVFPMQRQDIYAVREVLPVTFIKQQTWEQTGRIFLLVLMIIFILFIFSKLLTQMSW